MRVILEFDEIVLEKLRIKADAEKRSRKNYMEKILENAANGDNPVLERMDNVTITSARIVKENNVPVAKFEMSVEEPYQSPANLFENYKQKIWATRSYAELKKVVEAFRIEPLLNRIQKQNLEAIANSHSSENGFYERG